MNSNKEILLSCIAGLGLYFTMRALIYIGCAICLLLEIQ
jgi:hypothetical protein